MARISYLEKDKAPDEVKRIYDQLESATGRVLNIFKIMAHSPKSLETFLPFYRAVTAGKLNPKLRELAYIRTAQLNRCSY